MLPFDDARWQTMRGGMGVPYDPRPTLRALMAGEDPEPIWIEYWNELVYQGDVGEASYAAAPYLVKWLKTTEGADWEPYALLAAIEIQRLTKEPPIPEWLLAGYELAWLNLLPIAIRDFTVSDDKTTQRTILAVLALSKGFLQFGTILLNHDESEIEVLLREKSG